MSSSKEVKARAIKLRDVLSDLGHHIKHSESLEVISKIEGYADWNTHTADIKKHQQSAEIFLDEMLDAASERNYEKATQRFEKEYLVNFTSNEFDKELREIREEFGSYLNRVYMGPLNGEPRSDYADRYPGLVRHVWQGIFENAEILIIVGIYVKDGKPYVSSFNFRSH